MIDRSSLPKNLRGENYKIDNPEIEFFDAAGRSEGSKLLLRNKDGHWEEVSPADINRVPLAIHHTFREGIARGLAERVGMLIMPAPAAIDACHFRLLCEQNLKPNKITEDGSKVRIRDVNIANPLLSADRALEIVVADDLQENVIRAATSEGEFLFEKEI